MRVGRGVLAAAAATLGVLVVAGCGGGDGEDPSRTAAVVPGGVAFYADAAVDPSDDQSEALDSSLGTLLGDSDFDGTIDAAIGGLFEGETISWSEDVEPWAGERGAMFVVDGDTDGAAVVEIDDEGVAEQTFQRLAGSDPDAGVYDLGDGDFARAAILDDYAVVGSDAAVEAAVEAADGESLLDADGFDAATGGFADDRIATIYVDPGATIDALVASGELEAGEVDRVTEALGVAGEAPVGFAFDADSDNLRAELSAGAGEGTPVPASSPLVDRVPDDAWIALAAGDAGPTVATLLEGVGDVLGELDPVGDGIGLDLAELAAATGDAAAYFGGTSLLGIRGAVMLKAVDPAAVTDALDRLADGLSSNRDVEVEPLAEGEGFTLTPADVPLQFPFVLRDDLLVAGLGSEAVEQAFEPSSSLAESEGFGQAAESLGDGGEPVAYIDFEGMLELLDAIPGLWDDPDLAAARPYLERLDDFVAGAREADGRSLVTMALRLRGESSE